MKKIFDLSEIVVCPICKQERRLGEMMTGGKRMCKYCYKDEEAKRKIIEAWNGRADNGC